jgi:two-component system, cell cycle sensor histidine kinase and response regulator CckA
MSAGSERPEPKGWLGSDGHGPADGCVVLIVDDDPAVLEVAAKVLERIGYEVLQAAEGAAALELVRSRTGPLDLVLTDVIMPGMSGRELGERIAQERPGTRFLYMSAYTEDEAIQYGVRVDGMRFLSKPFSLRALADAVREALAD